MARSPIRQPATPSPTASITPTSSWPERHPGAHAIGLGVEDVEIGAAESARFDAQAHLAGARLGHRDLLRPHLALAAVDTREHLASRHRLRTVAPRAPPRTSARPAPASEPMARVGRPGSLATLARVATAAGRRSIAIEAEPVSSPLPRLRACLPRRVAGGAGRRPSAFAGFFYHPRMLAVVHLVTLGWITSHILGALYLIAPMALRTRLRITRADRVAFWIYVVGVVGMVGHFWIGEMRGMAWAGVLVLATVVLVGARTAAALRRAPIDFGVKLHYRLAFVNIVGAGVLGLVLGLNRVTPLLGGEPLSRLYAHVHLAALGWATMTVFGSAQRLLPMLLPSALPPPSTAWASAVLLETAVAGLVWCFLAGGAGLRWFAVIAAAAVVWFFARGGVDAPSPPPAGAGAAALRPHQALRAPGAPLSRGGHRHRPGARVRAALARHAAPGQGLWRVRSLRVHGHHDPGRRRTPRPRAVLDPHPPSLGRSSPALSVSSAPAAASDPRVRRLDRRRSTARARSLARDGGAAARRGSSTAGRGGDERAQPRPVVAARARASDRPSRARSSYLQVDF